MLHFFVHFVLACLPESGTAKVVTARAVTELHYGSWETYGWHFGDQVHVIQSLTEQFEYRVVAVENHFHYSNKNIFFNSQRPISPKSKNCVIYYPISFHTSYTIFLYMCKRVFMCICISRLWHVRIHWIYFRKYLKQSIDYQNRLSNN